MAFNLLYSIFYTSASNFKKHDRKKKKKKRKIHLRGKIPILDQAFLYSICLFESMQMMIHMIALQVEDGPKEKTRGKEQLYDLRRIN